MKRQYLLSIITTVLFLNGLMIVANASLNLKGDLRLRSQIEDKKGDGVDYRHRQRIRFRLKGDRSLSDATNLQFGLATGGTDPRSTNQTLEGGFQTPDIRLDYVYLSHQLTNQMYVLAGKMKNPLWRVSDLLWDSDINPDGVAFSYQSGRKLAAFDLFMVGGLFVLDEKQDASDPLLIGLQPGVKLAMNEDVRFSTALGLYLTTNAGGYGFKEKSNSVSSKDYSSGNTTRQEFVPVVISSQLDIYNQFGMALLRPFGEFVINTKESNANKGATLGVKFGDKKVKGRGTWQVKANYRYLQSNAWLDILPDSDAYSGKTDAKGAEIAFNYGLSNAMSVGLDVYHMTSVSGSGAEEWLAQLDLKIKF